MQKESCTTKKGSSHYKSQWLKWKLSFCLWGSTNLTKAGKTTSSALPNSVDSILFQASNSVKLWNRGWEIISLATSLILLL